MVFGRRLVRLFNYLLRSDSILEQERFHSTATTTIYITPSIPNCKSFDFFLPQVWPLVLFKKFMQI